jgi:hypothetical protein
MMLQNALPAIGLLALMVLAAWLLQRYRRHLPGRAGHSAVPMEITGGISLGPQHRLDALRRHAQHDVDLGGALADAHAEQAVLRS